MNKARAWQMATLGVAALSGTLLLMQHRTAEREEAALRERIAAQEAFIVKALPDEQAATMAERRESQRLRERRIAVEAALARRINELTTRVEEGERTIEDQETQRAYEVRESIRERVAFQRDREMMQQNVDSLEALLLTPDGRELVNPRGVGFTYYGPVVNGKANGFGIGFFETGSVYRGTWSANMRNGRGTYRWADGDSYEGDFVDDQREGQGTYRFRSGERYVGSWKDDVREGYGEVFSPEGDVVSRGMWRADRYVRRGTASEATADSVKVQQ